MNQNIFEMNLCSSKNYWEYQACERNDCWFVTGWLRSSHIIPAHYLERTVTLMSNFSPYLSIPSFAAFAPIAESAEKILSIDPAACVLNCRRAMEAAVKWMYAVDGSLVAPWDDKLVTLINTEEFRGIVDEQLTFAWFHPPHGE